MNATTVIKNMSETQTFLCQAAPVAGILGSNRVAAFQLRKSEHINSGKVVVICWTHSAAQHLTLDTLQY